LLTGPAFAQSASTDASSSIQEQTREVLSGTAAAHVPQLTDSRRQRASRSSGDVQAFTRKLLLGWSASPIARARTTQQRSAASDPAMHQDIQALVRRQLLGYRPSVGGAT
jgi:hypothetical protein